MDPKVRDQMDRLAKLATEYENLNAELMGLLPPTSAPEVGNEPLPWTLTGEGRAKWDWITTRLREIQAWMIQSMDKIMKIEKERLSGH